MQRNPTQFGRLFVEDFGKAGCKITMLTDCRDESVAEILTHDQSTKLVQWLLATSDVAAQAGGVQPGDFGRRLTVACGKRGALAQLIRTLTLGQMQVYHWAWGHSLPLSHEVLRIAQYLGWDPDEAVRLVGDERVARARASEQKRNPDPVAGGGVVKGDL